MTNLWVPMQILSDIITFKIVMYVLNLLPGDTANAQFSKMINPDELHKQFPGS